MNDTYGCDVTPAAFFEHTTLGAFASYLSQVHPDHMRRHYAVSQAPAAAPASPAEPTAIALDTGPQPVDIGVAS